ncbi:MAG: DUF2076 domain-containing protein [Candidatus Symbiobacter sp.]|nr:DUF2076 domain-containing protein [Candidatus Symbiobacter sp.]
MTRDESVMIESLFSRLAAADPSGKNAAAKEGQEIDAEAWQLIQAKLAAHPQAAYLLVQTVLVQEQALKGWQERVQQLETEKSAGNYKAAPALMPQMPPSPNNAPTASLWRRSRPAFNAGPAGGNYDSPPGYGQPMGGGYGQPMGGGFGQPMGGGFGQPMGGGYGQPMGGYGQPMGGGFGGGGFLRSALTTAAGVAGGMLLYQGVSSMFSSHSGAGAESGASSANHESASAPAQDSNNYSEVGNYGGADGGGEISPASAYDQGGYNGGDYGQINDTSSDWGGGFGGGDFGGGDFGEV